MGAGTERGEIAPTVSVRAFASLVRDELAPACSCRLVSRLLAQALGVASPLVGELEEESAAVGIFGLLSGASAFLRVLLVEASERHGSSSIQVRGKPTLAPAGHPAGVSGNAAVQFSSAVLIFGHFGRQWAGSGLRQRRCWHG